MRFLRVLRRGAVLLSKLIVYGTLAILIALGTALAILETGWAKNRLRAVIVSQANQYLTATLEIGRLEGSLLRGIQLGDIRLSRAGVQLVTIDDVSLSYSVRELVQQGVVIHQIRLARPRVVMSRTPDGRWDLASIVKREARQEERTGPGRPIQIDSFEVYDGRVTLRDPLDFGAVHAPTEYDQLNVKGSFAYVPVSWRLSLDKASWRGPSLAMNQLSGTIENGPGGIGFRDLLVQTPRSSFSLNGRIVRGDRPTAVDLQVHADRLAFQEWAPILRGLENIAVDAAFDTTLAGPLSHVDTALRLKSSAGSVSGSLVLDTTVPGWHAAGAVDVAALNLAGWLNRADRGSDISGHVTFDLDLDLGRHFPRGTYVFAGPHVTFMDYAADDLRARGTITAREVLIANATARAYGANVTASSGSIGVGDPFPFRFQGTAAGVDLRLVPPTVPVPRVDSSLTFDYDITGRFAHPFIAGRAQFARSVFLGATIGAGTLGAIDTGVKPLRFSGDGDIHDLDLHRLGVGLEVGWLQEPRYAGTVSGRFRVEGSGTDRHELALTAGGRLERANLFRGRLFDADVTLDIAQTTLRTTYAGKFSQIDPAIPLADLQYEASLTGSANVRATVRDLLIRSPEVSDYDIDGAADIEASTIRGVAIDRGHVEGQFRETVARLARVEVTGPAIAGSGSGTVAFVSDRPSDFQYDVGTADLSKLNVTPAPASSGLLSTKGRMTGPWQALRLAGDASVSALATSGFDALTMNARYDVTIPSGELSRADARVTGQASFLTVAGQTVKQATGSLTFANERLGFDVRLALTEQRTGALTGSVALHSDRRALEVLDLAVTLDRSPWRLVATGRPPTIAWDDAGVTVGALELVSGASNEQRIGLAGTWRQDGKGALHVTASHVFLDTLQSASEQPARFGGVLDVDAMIRGTRDAPIVTGQIVVSNGRVRRFSYEKLAGRVDYAGRAFTVDLRLDQAPGVWIAAAGRVPPGLLFPDQPDGEIDLAVTSSAIGLGLLEGLTEQIRNVTGELRLDVHVVGTAHDPHFQGTVDIANAAFLATASGGRYKNGRAAIRLARDRITIDAFHLEDRNGRTLDVRGGLATHELTVGDLEIDATARRFEVLRNEFGHVEVDANLRLRGKFESPRVGGDITIAGGDLRVDEILDRLLFQPYATEQVNLAQVDAIAALNPWDRLGLDVSLHVPDSLKLAGENVQVTPGTPIGLGDINLRVGGDLYLYKDPRQPLSITGSLDRISGTYSFQGRRFNVDEPTSSINFRGDLDPELYVTVTRLISGVVTRVTLVGPLHSPALHLASTPPLESSDILSLIVFNTSVNQLTTAQQQELAVRAGTLAAGFLASPLMSALENALGLEMLALEPSGEFGTGPKVTIGEEIAPGLVARFSRQFGTEPYDEASIEYYLSRILRIRATFSDAGSLIARSPFRRIERAGIDLLFFFSF